MHLGKNKNISKQNRQTQMSTDLTDNMGCVFENNLTLCFNSINPISVGAFSINAVDFAIEQILHFHC